MVVGDKSLYQYLYVMRRMYKLLLIVTYLMCSDKTMTKVFLLRIGETSANSLTPDHYLIKKIPLTHIVM